MGNAYNIYEKMEQGNILLSFKGEITSDLLTSILQIMELRMDVLKESTKIKKKFYNILVESLQNLYHHLEKDGDDENFRKKSALLMIKKQEEEYSILTGNFIKNENVDLMKGRLDKVNGMNKEELKAYYREILNNGEMSDKGGGGLGMIDIARKSGKKLDYSFKDIDDNYSFFSLTIKVSPR